ncbi:MAG: zf-HC2 domain-containing protein [Acidobacteria bacterium]|nr:zf-HC2 domain-containing protein [Acidobacteriota bacterium]
MCEDRERLIGYVYDECEPAERRTIDAHLGDCVDCRQEVRALRATRQDLLAWEVPEPGPLWRPFAAQRPAWSSIPAWAMAAAAGLVLAVGAAGGAMTHALRTAAAPAAVASNDPAAAAPALQSTVMRLEQRVRDLERSNETMGELVRVLSSRPAAGAREAEPGQSNVADLAHQLRALTERQDELSRTVTMMGMETMDLKSRQVGLQRRNEMLVSLSLGQSAATR